MKTKQNGCNCYQFTNIIWLSEVTDGFSIMKTFFLPLASPGIIPDVQRLVLPVITEKVGASIVAQVPVETESFSNPRFLWSRLLRSCSC